MKVIRERLIKTLEYDLEETDLFCPNCGNKDVHRQKGEGDYYTGPSHYCTNCNFDFAMPYGGVNEDLKFE